MQCNIDERGRALRRNSGFVCCLAGLVLGAYALLTASSRPYFVAGLALVAAGLFQLYEGRKGWCALRAMGIKTPV